MNSLEKCLIDEEHRYRRILNKLKSSDQEFPEGYLVVHARRSGDYYYQVIASRDGGPPIRAYLNRRDGDTKRLLAQKSYNEKVKKLVAKRLGQIYRLRRQYRDDEIDRLYDRLVPGRKRLVEPVQESWAQLLKRWKEIPYQGKGFADNRFCIYTKKQERVRSKSEKILADFFTDMGLVYKYECPLRLANGITFHPDFTFLSPYTREEVYWEHNGMMDDPNYLQYALKKLVNYEMNGIVRGRDLIITYETSAYNLDLHWAEALAKEYLIRE